MQNNYVDLPVEGGAGSGVSSLNGLSGALTLVPGTGITITPSGSTILISSTSTGGTVTAVGLADSTGLFNITGSPVTTAGTLTLASFKSQSANTFLAAPNGSSGAPTFRTIVPADVPTLNQNTTGTAGNITATSNSTLVTLSSLSLPYSQVTGGPTGSVTSISVVSANGFAGTVTNPTTTPAITLSTTINGILFGNGTSVVAAVAGNFPTLNQNTSGTAANITATSNSTLVTLSALSLPTSQLSGSISLTTQVSGVLPIANGGTGQSTANSALNALLPSQTGNAGEVLSTNGTNTAWIAAGGTGTVTSVGLADSTGLFNITGSPVTTTGTLTLASFASQSANTFLAAPNGSSGAPTFRGIAVGDVPTLNQNTTGTASNVTGVVAVANGGTGQGAALTPFGVVYAASSTTMATTAAGTATLPLISNGTSAPTFQKLNVGIAVTGTLPVGNGGTAATTVAGARTSLGIDAGSSFITSGTTYTTPASITTATEFKFTLVGGGGGGASTNSIAGGGAGGGGAGALVLFVSGLSPSTAYTIAIGAAGAGSTSTGSSGGNTTLTIGATTYTASGGTGAAALTTSEGGVGGTATNGTINITGAGGDAASGVATAQSGSGGCTGFGLGLGGNGVIGSANGNSGTGFGGGGGGAKGNGAPTSGSGTQGAILVEYYN